LGEQAAAVVWRTFEQQAERDRRQADLAAVEGPGGTADDVIMAASPLGRRPRALS
jgi:NAD(P)H-hydrate repair Nnr-like enzyme with NAD(P)H-hydrate epimerase domain